MRLNEKNVASFAVCSSPVDKEGYLQKKGDLNREFQRRWFVLKGNLLFYFLKKQDREPQGVIVLEACSVQVSVHGRYCFEISFDGAGTRIYVLGADNNDEMESWMKAISHASYEYLKTIVDELQRRVDILSSSSTPQAVASGMGQLKVGVVATMPSSTSPTPQAIKTVGVPGDPTVTLDDLSRPAAPKQHPKYNSTSVKVKKGILVNNDQAPPIPAKKKSVTMHGLNRSTTEPEPGHSTYTEELLKKHQQEQQQIEDQMDAAMLADPPLYHTSSTQGHAPFKGTNSIPPTTAPMYPSSFSSPIVPNAPLEDPRRPLSPPSTLDRTPVLVPSPVKKTNSQRPMTEKEIGGTSDIPSAYHEVNLPASLSATTRSETEVGVATLPSRYPPQANRKLVAPLDPSKTFMEMHQDFAEAMKSLHVRTSDSDAPS